MAKGVQVELSSFKSKQSDSGLWSTFNEHEAKIQVVVSEFDVRHCIVMPEFESVQDLKKRLFREELRADKRIRLIFQGKLLLDSYKLARYSKS